MHKKNIQRTGKLERAPDQDPQYTSGFLESNKGYDDLRYHNGRAHESQPNKFTATNRGKDWTKKEYY